MNLNLRVKLDLSGRSKRWIEQTLASYLGPRPQPKVFIAELEVGQLRVRGEIMAFQLKDSGPGSTARARIVTKTAAGNPADVQNPTWSVSDTSLLTITPDPDGKGAQIAAVGPLGTAQVQFSCDADLGEGVKTISGQGDVEIIAGEAATAEIQFSQEPATPEQPPQPEQPE